MTVEFAGAVLIAGLVGFDPIGAVLALAAIGAGARRRGIGVFTNAFLIAMVLVGMAGGAAARWIARRPSIVAAMAFARAHDLLAWAEVGVGALGVATGVMLILRARGRRGARDAAASARLVERVGRRLASTPVLAAAGVALAVNLATDPGFALLAVAVREQPLAVWPPAWLAWATLSQILLVAVAATAQLDRSGHRLERVAAWVRAVLVRADVIVRVGITVLGATLLVDGIPRVA